MKILCPSCSQDKPLVIPITRRDNAAICPECFRRYKLETFALEGYRSEEDHGRTRYLLLCKKERSNKNISLHLQKSVPLQRGTTYTLISRNGIPLGLANQDQSTWNTLFPFHRPWTLANKLSLFLTVPIIILAVIQASRIPSFLEQQDLQTFIILLLILLPFLVAPAIFWLFKEVFRGEERNRHIPGYHAEEEDL